MPSACRSTQPVQPGALSLEVTAGSWCANSPEEGREPAVGIEAEESTSHKALVAFDRQGGEVPGGYRRGFWVRDRRMTPQMTAQPVISRISW